MQPGKRELDTADADDAAFVEAFERCRIEPAEFDHAAHVRLAYVYLCKDEPEAACARMKSSLLRFLAHAGADPGKFHETMTRAWILAVRHFMDEIGPTQSSAEFVARAPDLLDGRIMLTHYSAEILFSDAARTEYVEPDRQPIPPPPAKHSDHDP